ncbi:type VI secretion system Vgr family protein [Chondromyces crocatus]|uniref:Gp5/Type VI secretion system Vgr protein OB-fold domain-containing protein n=1 Tax=Chondromyces crocatus TaxID=52 RepID=A0A0K1ES75_CHOCO|nr:type VI secretion system tip protein TssI/VgrG [Chondromyces crocatus]AKT43711.1 uncharacterized protein CMC5_079460 [Chondromyces crocatus]
MSDDQHVDIQFESEVLEPGVARVAELHGREVISQLFSFDVLLVSADPEGIDSDVLAGAPATLVFSRGEEELRRVHGIISSVRDQLDTESKHVTYRVTVVPRAYQLTLHETLDVFMDLSVPEIITHILEYIGLTKGTDFEFRLREEYPRRDFVVQYKETDLAFVSRLLEHLGMSFFFEHANGRDVFVVTDHNGGFQPFQGGGIANFRARGEQNDIYRLETETRLIPSQYVVRDYNYRTPQVDLTAQAETDVGHGGRVIEYGSHFKTPEEGARIAQIRAEERAAQRRVFHGAADLPELAAGATCKVEGHPWGDVMLLLTEVEHTAKPTALAGSDEDIEPYVATFRAVRNATPYRPPRITPKPRVHGILTGAIDASDRGEKYAQIDNEGRYRVRFIFDTWDVAGGQASRPVRMAQPHSGPGYGMHFPLRPGVEVALTCIDGDPDRPIIMGTLPNPTTPSPVVSDNAPRNIIRTGAGNEINIDDTEGSERIKLSTPHSSATLQLGSPNSPEDGVGVSAFTNFTAATGASANTLTSMGNMFGIYVNTMANHVTNIAGKLTVPMVVEAVVTAIDTGLGIMSGALEATQEAAALTQTAAEYNRTKKKSELDSAVEDEATAEKQLTLAIEAAAYDDSSEKGEASAELLEAMEAHKEALLALQEDELALAQLEADQTAAADEGKHAVAASYDAPIEEYTREGETAAEKGKIQLKKEALKDAQTALDAAIKKAKETCKDTTVTLADYPTKGESKTVTVEDAIKEYETAQSNRTTARADYETAKEDEAKITKALEDSGAMVNVGHAKDSIENTRSLVAATAGNGLALWSIYALATGTGLDAYAALGSNLLITEATRQFRSGNLPKVEWADSGWLVSIKTKTTPAPDTHGQIARLDWWDIPMLKQAGGSSLIKFAASDQWKEGRQIVGSEGHTIVFGKESLFLSGQDHATLSSRDKVVVTSNDQTVINARKDTEVAGGDRLLLTSATLVDVLSRGTVKIASVDKTPAKDKDRTTIDLGHDALKLASCDPNEAPKATIELSTSVAAKGTIELKTAAQQYLKFDETLKTTTLDAFDTLELKAAQTASLLAGGGAKWGLRVDAQKGEIELGSSQWKLTIKNNDVDLGRYGANGVTLKSDFARLRKGQSLVKLTDDKALLQSFGTVQIDGQTVKANGKILLG